jgi:colanic acid biosynthesis glycosyl transferase WcaI
VISQYFHPDPIPKPLEVAEELLRRGHQVSVLCGLPNYPTGVYAAGYGPAVIRREIISEVPVLRVFEFAYHGRSAARRIINYGSFAVAAVLASPLLPRFDVIYAWHPPLTVGLVATLISRLRGVPFVYDVQDIWPDIGLMTGLLHEGTAVNLLRTLERLAYRHAAHILVPTPGAMRNLTSKGVSPQKVSILPHWTGPEAFSEVSKEDLVMARDLLDARERFVVTFAGNIGLVQGLDTLLDAASQLKTRRDIAIRIVGGGPDRARLESISQRMGLPNVAFFGPFDPVFTRTILAASDALFVHVRAGTMNDLALPTKTLSYLAAARPVIMAMRGDATEVIKQARAGVVLPPDDPRALAEAISGLASASTHDRVTMGTNGREYARVHFARGRIFDDLERTLASHAKPHD